MECINDYINITSDKGIIIYLTDNYIDSQTVVDVRDNLLGFADSSTEKANDSAIELAFYIASFLTIKFSPYFKIIYDVRYLITTLTKEEKFR